MTTIALATLIVLAAVMALLIIILVLWQKRSREQLDVMQKMVTRLEELRDSLEAAEKSAENEHKQEDRHEGGSACEIPTDAAVPEPDSAPKVSELELVPVAETPEGSPAQTKAGQEPGEQDTEKDRGREQPATSIYNIGKSGKIYTEEELVLLIKE